jgi:putative solute:sodium symporter small subunit
MKDKNSYWKQNISLITRCLLIWFTVSYVFGILLVDYLNLIRMGGYKLGFWFSQQGAIYIFVLLIFYYAREINKIDKKYKGT